MSKLKLLILDANVVIHLHEFGKWEKFLAVCDVHLPLTVVEESNYYEIDGDKQYIDLTEDVEQARVIVFEVPNARITAFQKQFDPLYLGELDPGELEALAYLIDSTEEYLISSSDIIVYRVLGRLNRGEQGISLEELLKRVGLQQANLPSQCTKSFREKHTKTGETDAVQGLGLVK